MPNFKMNRREFLKTSLKTGGFAYLLHTFPLAGSIEASVIQSFHSEPDELTNLLQTASRRGGDHADIFLEQTAFRNLFLDNGKIRDSKRDLKEGTGIRVFNNDQTAFSYTDSFSKRSARRTAREVSREIRSDKSVGLKSLPRRPAVDAGVIIAKTRLEHTSVTDIAQVLNKLRNTGLKASNLLTNISFDYHDEIRRILVADTSGRYVTDTQPMIDLRIRCSAEQGSQTATFEQRVSHRSGFDLLTNPSLEKILFETASRAVESLVTKPVESSRLPVVMLPQASACLAQSLVLALLDLSPQYLQTFRFPSGLTLTDNGRVVNGRGSSHFDDEGTRTSETVLISDGSITGRLNRRNQAQLSRAYLTGNARRCSYNHPPMVSPTNTYLEISDSRTGNPAEELDDGLLVTAAELITGSQTDTGGFELLVTAGHRVKGKRRIHPVKDVLISGQLADIFHRIEIVGNTVDFKAADFGDCGIPVSYGSPPLKFSSMTIEQK